MIGAILITGIAMGCVYGLVALGFSLIFRAMGLINFAQGEMLTIGALVGFSAIVSLHLPYFLGVLIAIVFGGVVSLVIERFIYAPIRKREDATSPRSVFATIAMLIVIPNGAKAIWGSDAFSYPTIGSYIKVGSMGIASNYLLVIAVTAVIMIVLNFILYKTKLGLTMRAYADDPATASLMGVKSQRVANTTCFLAGALGALGGVLLAQIYYASYNLGGFGLKAFTAAILGGLGSVPGAVIGGILLGLFENAVSFTITTAYKDAIVFGGFIVLLLFKPSGIFKT